MLREIRGSTDGSTDAGNWHQMKLKLKWGHLRGYKCQNLTKIHDRTEQTTKESGKIKKTKNHLWHLCTLLLSIINTNKTPRARVTVGKVSQARKSYCLQTQLSWWLSGSLPIRNLLQERGAKCPQGQRTMELLTHLPNLHEGGPYSPSLSGQPLITCLLL